MILRSYSFQKEIEISELSFDFVFVALAPDINLTLNNTNKPLDLHLQNRRVQYQ